MDDILPDTITIDNSFTNSIEADPITDNFRRQVDEAYSYVVPQKFSSAKLLHVSTPLAHEIGLTDSFIKSDAFKDLVTGQNIPESMSPFAMNYVGHQFGTFAGQLGDGRAINLMETTHNNKRFTWQLKGAGETPYSRSADGKAVLRSSIREHVCSEAMHFLGVPTTRSLSLSLTGEDVLRDMMYDGNQAHEKGAVICRVAPTFLRFGNYQLFAAKRDKKRLINLLDYTIAYFFPHLEQNQSGYKQFFQEVVESTLHLMIEWMRVGFVHGVMNTDNMSILGLTIDYGPYGWQDNYNPSWTPNTTDSSTRRYRFGNQAQIGLWNLYQLAQALAFVVEDKESLQSSLSYYQDNFTDRYNSMMKAKTGLYGTSQDDEILIQEHQKTMLLSETDYTIFYRELAEINSSMNSEEALNKVNTAFYHPQEIQAEIRTAWLNWFNKYIVRLKEETIDSESRRSKMNLVNPRYIFRNYLAQEAIEKADKGDYSMMKELFEMIQNPYVTQAKFEKYYTRRPEYARHKIGCSMLSCSS